MVQAAIAVTASGISSVTNRKAATASTHSVIIAGSINVHLPKMFSPEDAAQVEVMSSGFIPERLKDSYEIVIER